jgi:hypothetical protein
MNRSPQPPFLPVSSQTCRFYRFRDFRSCAHPDNNITNMLHPARIAPPPRPPCSFFRAGGRRSGATLRQPPNKPHNPARVIRESPLVALYRHRSRCMVTSIGARPLDAPGEAAAPGVPFPASIETMPLSVIFAGRETRDRLHRHQGRSRPSPHVTYTTFRHSAI